MIEALAFGAGEEAPRWEFTQDECGCDHVEEEQSSLFQVLGAAKIVGGGEDAERGGEVRVEEVLAAEVVFVGDDVGFGVQVEEGGDGGGVDIGVDGCA